MPALRVQITQVVVDGANILNDKRGTFSDLQMVVDYFYYIDENIKVKIVLMDHHLNQLRHIKIPQYVVNCFHRAPSVRPFIVHEMDDLEILWLVQLFDKGGGNARFLSNDFYGKHCTAFFYNKFALNFSLEGNFKVFSGRRPLVPGENDCPLGDFDR